MSNPNHYEVFAIRYADCPGRIRADSFIFDTSHQLPHDLDFFIWIIRNDDRTILVDTGFDRGEAQQRERPILLEPAEALAEIGIDPASIDTTIITHLHFDHAGGLEHFPNSRFHLQEAEMVYATGPCMCHKVLKRPFTAEHVCQMVRRVYKGNVVFHDGDAVIAPGVTVHKVGGHSRGLQVVRVETADGPLVLASDAAHYYENYEQKNPFPLVVDVEDMLKGFDRLTELAGPRRLIVPGHDPLVRERFPTAFENARPGVWRLDLGELPR